MKAFAAKSPIGVFVFSEEGEIVYYKLFSNNPAKAVSEYQTIGGVKVEGYDVQIDIKASKMLRKNLRDYSISLGFSNTEEEFGEFLNNFGILYSKKRLVGKVKKDRILIHTNNALE